MSDTSPDIKNKGINRSIDTDVATVSLRNDGIVESIDHPVAKNALNIKPMLDAYKELSGNGKKPFFIDPTAMPSVSADARKLAVPVIKESMSAFAVINKNPLANLVMKLMFSLDGINIPAKAFKDKEKAINWLRQFT